MYVCMYVFMYVCSLNPQQYLEYHYYGGLICIGLKKYFKALEFFQMVIVYVEVCLYVLVCVLYACVCVCVVRVYIHTYIYAYIHMLCLLTAQAMTCPGSMLSVIQIATFRKFILCSLIAHGEVCYIHTHHTHIRT